MARSDGLALISIVPCVKSGVISAVSTPRPDLPRIGAAAGCRRTGAQALRLQELRGEDGLGGLEANRVRVGHVVAHHVDGRFGRRQACQRRA